MPASLADARHAAELARPLARYELLLSAAIGFAWGPLLFHFLLRVADWTQATLVAAVAALTIAVGWAGARAPAGWYRLRSWERAGAGRVYERWLGVRWFKRWMSHGDRMNAALRRRVPGYRVVHPTAAGAAAYAASTLVIEREHLAWGAAALVPLAYGMSRGAHGFAALLLLSNLITNAWPIALQRYNRGRAERVARRRTAE
jgi:hypothetical protein